MDTECRWKTKISMHSNKWHRSVHIWGVNGQKTAGAEWIKLSLPIRLIEMGLREERALNVSLQMMQFPRGEMAAGALDNRTVWQKYRMRRSPGLVKGCKSKQEAQRKARRKILFDFTMVHPPWKGKFFVFSKRTRKKETAPRKNSGHDSNTGLSRSLPSLNH